MQAARDDYQNASRVRQMQASLPKAWAQLIADEDDLLLEIVADRVESLFGFKPDPDMVAAFLKECAVARPPNAPQPRPAPMATRSAAIHPPPRQWRRRRALRPDLTQGRAMR
jgi:hypothetical protein